MPRHHLVAVLPVIAALAVAGCGAAGAPSNLHGRILAVGAENEYANVIAQVGGRDVDAVAVMSNPNTDPHTFEASPSIAQTVARAGLIVQNGLGYDDFMDKIESATGGSSRRVITAQRAVGVPSSTANPHLWYDPRTMPAVAHAIATDLAALRPADGPYFRARAARFIASLRPWTQALVAFHRRYPQATVATTEPVADDMLAAAGAHNLTPFSMQADIMNGTDPAPQAVSRQNSLLSGHRVRAFVYNQQVTDSVTDGFLKAAASAHVPVVGVYETMPTGYDYQSWMIAELRALSKAVGHGVSTTHLTGP